MKKKNTAAELCNRAGLINAKTAGVINATREGGDINPDTAATLTIGLSALLYMATHEHDEEYLAQVSETIEEISHMNMDMTDAIISLCVLTSVSLLRLSRPEYWSDGSMDDNDDVIKQLTQMMKDVVENNKAKGDDNVDEN